ncbi:hypothetical protein D9Q98_004951 [Chlorella vulgaris]|uniref:Uncharacterized protein n=1 Tax=Chlorella vulgaris TaxID=3077 RepID=A0A9D4TNJ3_CHLVU|nr:hypothetical protein D9Q98_004951 [Chlorella vulgaris]
MLLSVASCASPLQRRYKDVLVVKLARPSLGIGTAPHVRRSAGCHALPRRQDVPPAAEDLEAAQFDAMGFAAKVFRVVAAYPLEYANLTFIAVFTLFFGYMVGAGWSMFAMVGVPPIIAQTYVCWNDSD